MPREPLMDGDTLLLAVPRPVVLGRCLEAATTLGFTRILLFRAWHTDKSHLGAKALQDTELAARVSAGLRQAERDRPGPRVEVFPLFRPFVEDHLDGMVARANRFVAHRDASTALASAPVAAGPLALAIGPERGFTPFEVELLGRVGFAPVTLGTSRLRVETALAFAAGALAARRPD